MLLTLIKVLFLCILCLVCTFIKSEACATKVASSSHLPCETSTGAKGECTKLAECASIFTKLEGRPFFGVGTNFNSICADGSEVNEVCCPLPKVIDGKIENSQHQQGHALSHEEQLLRPPHCGEANAYNRIVGGSVAERGAWPWIADISIRFGDKNENSEHVCGGSLITSKHVLTAGHCMEYEETPYFVQLGVWDLDKAENETTSIVVEVKNWTIHPSYNDVTKENDIAVLELEKHVTFSDAIKPICLPLDNDVRTRNYVGDYPYVIGWGTVSYGGPSSNFLREVQVPVVDTGTCKKAFAKKKHTIIDDRLLCAGYPNGGKDACQGDSGGPLMYPKKASYYLIGIVSNGFRCAQAGYPGLYTRVTYFIDFVLSRIK